MLINDGSDGKESAFNVADLGSTLELGRYPGEGNGNPFQYSCLENSMDRYNREYVMCFPKNFIFILGT